MPQKDRRNAHRYAPARAGIRIGWWEGNTFRSSAARFRNVSLSGALLQLDPMSPIPAGARAWICVADQSAPHWVESEFVEHFSEPVDASMDALILVRLRFVEPFPYESFKTAVWDDIQQRIAPTCGDPVVESLAPQPAPSGSLQDTRRLSDADRLRFFLQIDTQPRAGGQGGSPAPDGAAEPDQPPTLVEAYRNRLAAPEKLASLPWVFILASCATLACLLGLVVTGNIISLRRLAIVLGLAQ